MRIVDAIKKLLGKSTKELGAGDFEISEPVVCYENGQMRLTICVNN